MNAAKSTSLGYSNWFEVFESKNVMANVNTLSLFAFIFKYYNDVSKCKHTIAIGQLMNTRTGYEFFSDFVLFQ